MKYLRLKGITIDEYRKLPLNESSQYVEEDEFNFVPINCSMEEFIEKNDLMSLEDVQRQAQNLADEAMRNRENE